jgi:hypothetical protein
MDKATWILLGLVACVATWWGLLGLLWLRLVARHRHLYHSLGGPQFVALNSLASGWLTLKFILMRQHRPLGDRYLSFLADAALGIFLCFAAGFLYLVVGKTHP